MSDKPHAAGNVGDDRSAQPPSPPTASRGLMAAIGALLAAELVLALAYVVSPSLRVDPRIAYAIGFLAVCASAIGVARALPLLPAPALVGLVLPCALLWVVGSTQGEGLPAALAVTAALLIGGTLIGTVVGGRIEHPGQLLFVAIVSGAADLASVLHPTGPSATLANTPAALALLALPWPMLGTPELPPFLGVGDVVFTALYIAGSRRHGLPLGRTVACELLAFVATLCLVIAFQTAIPVLPVLGVAIVLGQPRARRPSERDRKRGFAIAALAVALVAVLLLRSRR